MRSLTAKLTLAFLLVGVIGAALVALLVGLRTRSEFDRFLSTRDQGVLRDALAEYYTAQGSWDGVSAMLAKDPTLSFYSRSVALVDANKVVVLGNRGYTVGQQASGAALGDTVAVQARGQTVGTLIVTVPPGAHPGDPGPPPAETAFVWRVTVAAAMSAGIAALMALLLGGLLARTLTRPVRELIAATQRMAGGTLDQRVVVRSRDEIGQLATSFNQMSADLARASQLRKQMTADLAHDLRTPLTILRGYTEGLKDARLNGSSALYAIMHDEVEHLQRLVDDLRVLSLADAGELPLNRRTVDPRALIERTGLAYIVQAEQQGIGLRVEADEGLPSIDVDTDRMTQVLNNLVSNALRYTTQGAIVLSASAENQHVDVKVSDTGSGIDADDLPFVFDRFYRADKARQRTDSNASGLGLAIAKAIVEAHGGSIAVTSTPGQGTSFTISLPAKQHAGGQAIDAGARARARVEAPVSFGVEQHD
ncbi:MAG: HAMP domain-containing histidine kinase [Kouleothrix sp.]|nr:HAMP domain-containing histidine kinase [Kouleothrix sp.]